MRTYLRKGLLLVFLSSVVPFVIIEVGLRVWISNFGTEGQRIRYTYSGQDIIDQVIRFRGVPYINFGLSPAHPEHNSLGYRGPEIEAVKPDGVFRIVALGGSTTYGDLIPRWQDAYPAQLEQILRDEHGYTNVEVVNAGVPSYSTWETLVNFQFRVLDLDPDLIIVYHGINDLSARVAPPEVYRGLSPAAGLWRTEAPDLSPIVLHRYVALKLGWLEDPANVQELFVPQHPKLRCCEGFSDDELAARIRANPPIYFERNLRNLIAVAQLHNVGVMLSSWTYFPDPTNGPGINGMSLGYRQDAIAEHNAVVAKLAEETGAAFYDIHNNFPYNRDFWIWDGTHLTEPGTREQARLYADFLIESGLLPDV